LDYAEDESAMNDGFNTLSQGVIVLFLAFFVGIGLSWRGVSLNSPAALTLFA
jgi:hypothetical protein